MPNTENLSIPYPASTASPNGAQQMQLLAERIDEYFEPVSAKMIRDPSLGDQAVADSTDVQVGFQTVMFENPNSFASAANDTFTTPYVGDYLVVAQVSYTSGFDGPASVFLDFSGDVRAKQSAQQVAGSGRISFNLTYAGRLASGTVISAYTRQESGDTQHVTGDGSGTWIYARLIH